MIRMKNIKRYGDLIELWVESIDCGSSYQMVFNYKDWQYLCSIDNPPDWDRGKIMYKLSGYIERGEPLPEIAHYVWG